MTIGPAIVFFRQMQRHLIMRQRHQRLNPVLMQLIKHHIIESQPRLIRFTFFPGREDAAPGNRHPVHLEAHLRHQCNIFLVMMIEVRSCTIRIVAVLFRRLRDSPRAEMRAVGQHIGIAQSLAITVIAALKLIGSRRSSPEKVLRKRHDYLCSSL